MGSLIHIAEVAALVFVAYVVGWFVGYILHRLVARPAMAVVAVAPAPHASAPAGQSDDALIKAPVVAPVVASTPQHIQARATQIEPATAVAVPDGMVLAEARSIDAPKVPAAPVSAIESLKSLTTAIPLAPIELRPIAAPEPAALAAPAAIVETIPQAEAAPPAIVEPVAPQPEPEAAAAAIPEPPPVPVAAPVSIAEPSPTLAEPEASGFEIQTAPSLAMPSSRPGVAWSGAIKGREATTFDRAMEAGQEAEGQGVADPSAGLDVALLGSLADELEVDEPALPIAELSELAGTTESTASPLNEIEAVEPMSATVVEPEVEEPPVLGSQGDAAALAATAEPLAPAPESPVVPAPIPPPQRQFDEDAAMRAIEGGWSRRQTRAMSDAHELTDVSAAVSAAQVAVEQVLAAKGIDASEQGARSQASFGKPKGLPHPRNHQRDNLKQINGLGPLDESSLNNLGIYHFDQIAAWDQKEVLWLENHAFARGRIGREDWQGQARSLMVDSEAARRIGG